MILRNQSKFLVKRNGIALSSEPGNLKNKHSFKYSTLANSKAIGLERAEDGAVLSTKLKTKKSPKGMFKKVTLKRDFRRVAKSIKGACALYRPDLEKDALAKWTVIHRSLGEKKKTPTKSRALRKFIAKRA